MHLITFFVFDLFVLFLQVKLNRRTLDWSTTCQVFSATKLRGSLFIATAVCRPNQAVSKSCFFIIFFLNLRVVIKFVGAL